MSENQELSQGAIGALEAIANFLGATKRRKPTKGAILALETVESVGLNKYQVQILFGLDSERVIEDWRRKGVCNDGIPFPDPVPISDRIHRWDRAELMAWWEKKKAKRAGSAA